jgi:hypothetical protein
VPATCPYPEPDQSSPCPPIPHPKDLQAPYIPCTESHVPFLLLRSCQRISPGPRQRYTFPTNASFYGELLAPRQNSKQEDYSLSVVHDCLFNIFEVTLHTGVRSSIRNQRTRHAVVTGANLWSAHFILHFINLIVFVRKIKLEAHYDSSSLLLHHLPQV